LKPELDRIVEQPLNLPHLLHLSDLLLPEREERIEVNFQDFLPGYYSVRHKPSECRWDRVPSRSALFDTL
jgi:hypothetical protein